MTLIYTVYFMHPYFPIYLLLYSLFPIHTILVLIHMEGLGSPRDPPVAKLLFGPAACLPCYTAAKLPLVYLSCRAASLPSCQTALVPRCPRCPAALPS